MLARAPPPVCQLQLLILSMTPPATSKTAKKKAGLQPLKIPNPPLVTEAPAEGEPVAEDAGAATAADSAPSKGIQTCKRRVRRQFEIPCVTFRRLVHEIAGQYKSDLRFQREAVEALQEASEILVSERFARCSQLVDLCKLDTVRDEHWRFVQGEGGLLLPCSGTS